MKKVLMTLLVSLLAVPAVAFAEEQYGTVTDTSKADSAKVGEKEISPAEGNEAKVTVTYSNVSLNKVEELQGEGAAERPAGYAWLGIKVTAPTSKENAKWTRTSNVELPTELQRTDVNVSDTDSDYYFPVSVDLLKAALETDEGYLEYTYTFTWKEGVTQTVTIKIVPEGVKLYEDKDAREEDGETIWDEKIMEDYVEKLKSTDSSTKKDDVPDTGNSVSMAIISAILLAVSAGAYSLKLAFSKK